MKKEEIFARVDHTQLKATATWADIQALCEEATVYHTASVCIPPAYLRRARQAFPALTLCTVIGCVTQAKADYIKTSTGFGTAGAQMEDIALFRQHIGAGVKIKAAGGIRTREAMEAFCEAGCDRIGCSAAVKALAGEDA